MVIAFHGSCMHVPLYSMLRLDFSVLYRVFVTMLTIDSQTSTTATNSSNACC